MTKKIVDILTTTLLIIVAIFALINLVGCGETKTKEEDNTTGLVEVETDMAKDLAKWYRYNNNVQVKAYKENGEIVNYYVTLEVNNETVAHKYTTDGVCIGTNYGEDYYDAMVYFTPAKP